MYYPSSENKGADQLRGYREADLRLCFRLCRLLVFPWGGSNVLEMYESLHEKACLGFPTDVTQTVLNDNRSWKILDFVDKIKQLYK